MTPAYWIGLLWLALGGYFTFAGSGTVHAYFALGASAFFFGVHFVVHAIERTKK